MTRTPPPPEPPPAGAAPAELTWTMGEAAAYLNAGGIDFGLDARAVRRLADSPANPIRAVGHQRRRWRRALASTVRQYRAQLLADAGRCDPEWPGPGEAAAAGGPVPGM